MSVLAKADTALLQTHMADAPALPPHTILRGPETGLVMVRGRAGGGGAAFNVGEMSVTRCTVRDAAGRIGHAYVAGRDTQKAELAARLDAVLQGPESDRFETLVIAPLAAEIAARATADAERAAATRVNFFTLATMRTSA
jgi:alpha-D-ribose 1-methylphosphonate 5-triphosphate synthase subunit PhnG